MARIRASLREDGDTRLTAGLLWRAGCLLILTVYLLTEVIR